MAIVAISRWDEVRADVADRFELQKWQLLLSLLVDLKTLDRII